MDELRREARPILRHSRDMNVFSRQLTFNHFGKDITHVLKELYETSHTSTGRHSTSHYIYKEITVAF